ncbi:MAG: hypothetical protein KDB14_28090 [Planctomycetales bacterium]|nr:hypothetical protein [Planctomycetales bacterium]
MNTAAQQRGSSLMDSPWYWMHLFCVAALIGLVLVGPRFAARQAGVERKFQGRQRASLNRAGKAPDTPLSSEDNLHVKLGPLYGLFASGATLSWWMVWRRRYRVRAANQTTAAGAEPHVSPPVEPFAPVPAASAKHTAAEPRT